MTLTRSQRPRRMLLQSLMTTTALAGMVACSAEDPTEHGWTAGDGAAEWTNSGGSDTAQGGGAGSLDPSGTALGGQQEAGGALGVGGGLGVGGDAAALGGSSAASGGSDAPVSGGTSATAAGGADNVGGSSDPGSGGRWSPGDWWSLGGSSSSGAGGSPSAGGSSNAAGGSPSDGGSSSAAGGSSEGGAGPSEEAAEFVTATNAVRAAVLEPPNYSGTWSPLPAVTWSDTVAASAQAWADELATTQNCGLRHESQNLYGENLAAGTNLTPAAAVELWAGEEHLYSWSPSYSMADFNAGSGHYTQLVWRESVQIGCAIARCDRSVVISCRYSPPGNVINQPVY